MDKYTIDFTNVKYYMEVHEVIKKSLDFPDYYGGNWDAFWDCLTDIIGVRSWALPVADEANDKHWAAVEKYKEEAERRSIFRVTATGDPMLIEIKGLDVIERKFGDTAKKNGWDYERSKALL